jgi:hypothetical protein
MEAHVRFEGLIAVNMMPYYLHFRIEESTIKRDRVHSSETSMTIYQTIRHNISKDSNLNRQSHETVQIVAKNIQMNQT